ncbi:deoxycytidylate deaminase isoform X2 [Myotis daubentonii]|uniref:deoxycytidylate deaminase isoform X2 n=1 Tax=Myotis daubentonii TaxID=98922 RepID=UPI002873B3E0|nr:deoxycytidylate deaminase isoform X2 [Myotis daubentonii]
MWRGRSAGPSMSEVPCKKREDYLEWPEYFMAVAFLSAQRSKDPNSQVGACIVNAENKIVGIGYNGMPNGCSDDLLPWRRTAERKLDTKYPYGNSHPSAARLSLTLIPSTAGPARSFSESSPIKPGEVGITLPQGAGAPFTCKLHAPSRRRAAHGDAQLIRTKPHLPDSPVARSLHLTKLLI